MRILDIPRGILIKTLFYIPLILPHIIAFVFSNEKEKIKDDIFCRLQWNIFDKNHPIISLAVMLVNVKEFRNVFYMRVQLPFLQILCSPVSNVDMGDTHKIGGGLNLIHPYGTIINKRCYIGENCTIYQSVTIGQTDKGCPKIGNNVFIGSGAILIGDIKIGNNVKIGAGAVVVEDIPDNTTVVCPKMRIISKK